MGERRQRTSGIPQRSDPYPQGREAVEKGFIKLLASDENLLAYGRFEADEQIVIVVNNSDELRTVTVPVWYAGVEME